MSALVLQALSLSLPTGGVLLHPTDLVLDQRITALVGANGVGKSSLCRVLAGRAAPDGGRLRVQARVGWVDPVALEQASGSVADWLERAGVDVDVAAWLARLELAALEPDRLLHSLSGGERARLALAVALAAEPGYLILDEPAAHLDVAGRGWLIERMRRQRGGVLLVSHNRELLATASRVLELANGRLHDYALDFAAYRAARAAEQRAAERELADARRQQAHVRAQAQAARERAEQRAATGRRGRRNGDQGALYYDFVQERAEAAGGRRERAAGARIANAGAGIESARQRLRLEAKFDLRLEGRGPPAGRRLLQADRLSARAGERALFERLSFDVTGPERIGIVGRNGSGKSRLLRILAGLEAPCTGDVMRAAGRVSWLGQHAVPPQPEASLLDNLRAAQPALREDAVRERLAWFGFRADRVRQPAATLSRGERLRLALCCELGGDRLPQLLLLDEPDNHLDLDALATVEHALRQYPGALMVVSHSRAFLEAIGIERWVELG